MNNSPPEIQADRIEVPQPIERPPVKPRINLIEQVFWQAPEAKPILCETRLGFMVECEEEPYQRSNIRVNLPWQEIDLGWMKDNPTSQIVILNPGKKDDATIEIGIKVPDHKWILDYSSIKPGMSHRIDPIPDRSYHIRSRHKATKYSIRVFPL